MSSSYRAETVGSVSAWSLHLAALGSLLVLLGALYARSIAAAVTVWWVSPTFSHCFLIIPVSAYLIWGKRRELAVLTPSAYPRALLLALPVIGLSFFGSLASINELEQLAVVAFAQILALGLLGPEVYRKILFPALFLFFLVPMGEYLIGPLQRFTTWFIDQGLTQLGILHFVEGNLIELANGKFQVAEACAGLRFLIATISVGAIFAHITYRSWRKIGLFMLACVIVPIIGNGFRALGIVLLAHFSNNTIAVGADHLVYGWGFSVAILAALMFAGTKFADSMPDVSTEAPRARPRIVTPYVLPLTLLISLMMISLVPAYAAWRANTTTVADLGAPPALQGWAVEPVSRDWAPFYQTPDAKLEFAMRASAAPVVDVFAEYYADEIEGRNLISSANKMWDEETWHPIAQGEADAAIGEAPVRFREVQIGSAGISRLIWWTYVTKQNITTSALEVKLHRVEAALTGRQGAALLAVSTLVDSDLDAARARLKRAVADLEPVKRRIDFAQR